MSHSCRAEIAVPRSCALDDLDFEALFHFDMLAKSAVTGTMSQVHMGQLVDMARYFTECVSHVTLGNSVTPELSFLVGSSVAARRICLSYYARARGISFNEVLTYMDNELFSVSMRGSACDYSSLWHLSGSDDHQPGYCYLSMIASSHQTLAAMELGPWPTFARILALPHLWFVSEQELAKLKLRALAFTLGDCVVRNLNTLDVFVSIACASEGIFPLQTMGNRLRLLAAITPASTVVPPASSRLGGERFETVGPGPAVSGWHVEVEHRRRDPQYPEGMCYLDLFKNKCMVQAGRDLGVWPTFEAIVRMPYKMLRHEKCSIGYRLVANGSDEKYRTHRVMMMVSLQIEAPEEGSFAHGIQSRVSMDKLVTEGMPAPRDVVGGERILRLPMPYAKEEVRKYPLDVAACEEVVEETITTWGFPVLEEVVEVALTCVAKVLITGSSCATFQNSTIGLYGVESPLSVLVDALTLRFGSSGTIRNWAKSFRQGQMLFRVVGLLSCPENRILRQKAAMAFNVGTKFAYLCFDLAKAYSRLVTLDLFGRMFVRLMRYAKFAPLRGLPFVAGRYMMDSPD
jgi:hypothetical protein